jgi:hypothetical protein
MKYMLLMYANEADVAFRWAEKIPTARYGPVEICRLWSEES